MLHFDYNLTKTRILGKKKSKNSIGTVFGFIAEPDGQ